MSDIGTTSHSGTFIVFEGPDGAGKSTQIRLLAESMKLDCPGCVVATREPGGTRIGDALRSIMLESGDHGLAPMTWVLLMNAARSELVATVILPALQAGKTVLLDRYWYSTVAYQGAGEKVDSSVVRAISMAASQGIVPDLVILLDLPPEVGLSRKAESRATNVLDHRSLEFHVRVRDSYKQMASEDPHRWFVIDALEQPADVHQRILERTMQMNPGVRPVR